MGGGSPKFRAFFLLPLPFLIFLSLSGCLVEFLVFEPPGPSNLHVWPLGLWCETPAAPKHEKTRPAQGDPQGGVGARRDRRVQNNHPTQHRTTTQQTTHNKQHNKQHNNNTQTRNKDWPKGLAKKGLPKLAKVGHYLPLRRTPLRRTPPAPDRPKSRFFFPSPAPTFASSLSGCLLVAGTESEKGHQTWIQRCGPTRTEGGGHRWARGNSMKRQPRRGWQKRKNSGDASHGSLICSAHRPVRRATLLPFPPNSAAKSFGSERRRT